uniref:ATP-dependent RNA helicase n=1 Tax=Meloidogyne incognita TaxID=6306 RepID=A0A914KUY4_MELIC
MEHNGEWTEIINSEYILKGLDTMGFINPTPIQKAVIPQATQHRKDIIGAAETGSGKTLAFAVPIIDRWLKELKKDLPRDQTELFALVVTPTRELAIQIRDVFRQFSALKEPRELRIVAIVGGMSIQKQQRLLKSQPDIIVGTPGRLWALKESGEEHLNILSGLQIIVVDEIDRMLKEGHFKELKFIIKHIHSKRNEHFKTIGEKGPPLQTFVFSATLTFTYNVGLQSDGRNEIKDTQKIDSKQKVKQIARSMYMRRGPEKLAVVDLTTTTKIPNMLVECRMDCTDLLHKDANLFYLLKRYGGRTLVFCNSVSAVRRLQAILRKLTRRNIDTLPCILHGRMKEKERLKSVEKFAASENSVLLATDVAARGLDFQSVQQIIHYQVPQTTENYIHRSGRTARALNSGLSILFVDPMDLQYYQKICRGMEKNEDLEVLTVDDRKLFERCKYLVELATEAESIEHRGRKQRTKSSWFQRMAKEADLIWDSGEESISTQKNVLDDDNWHQKKMDRKLKQIETTLQKMLQSLTPSNLCKENNDLEAEGDNHNEDAKELVRKRIKLERGKNKWLKKRPKLK